MELELPVGQRMSLALREEMVDGLVEARLGRCLSRGRQQQQEQAEWKDEGDESAHRPLLVRCPPGSERRPDTVAATGGKPPASVPSNPTAAANDPANVAEKVRTRQLVLPRARGYSAVSTRSHETQPSYIGKMSALGACVGTPRPQKMPLSRSFLGGDDRSRTGDGGFADVNLQCPAVVSQTRLCCTVRYVDGLGTQA